MELKGEIRDLWLNEIIGGSTLVGLIVSLMGVGGIEDFSVENWSIFEDDPEFLCKDDTHDPMFWHNIFKREKGKEEKYRRRDKQMMMMRGERKTVTERRQSLE